MRQTRRSLLRLLPAALVLSAFGFSVRGQEPFPPPRQRPTGPGEDEPSSPEKASSKAALEENQKNIKKNVEKLFDLATQLKEQVEKTDSTTTLSLALVKKAEEIEKLARQIKERAKG
jgi:outer membrane lipopolysaccharide assembly protein LptE/RlpB